MLIKLLAFAGIFVVFAVISLMTSFYFGHNAIYKNPFYKMFFVIGACYLPAVILALIFRNTVLVKDLPYYLVLLASIIFILLIVPAWIKKQRK